MSAPQELFSELDEFFDRAIRDGEWDGGELARILDKWWPSEEGSETEPDASARYPHIVVQLTGEDGNAFAILGSMDRAFRDADFSQEVRDEFRKQATSGDYEHLLRTCAEWVTVR